MHGEEQAVTTVCSTDFVSQNRCQLAVGLVSVELLGAGALHKISDLVLICSSHTSM